MTKCVSCGSATGWIFRYLKVIKCSTFELAFTKVPDNQRYSIIQRGGLRRVALIPTLLPEEEFDHKDSWGTWIGIRDRKIPSHHRHGHADG